MLPQECLPSARQNSAIDPESSSAVTLITVSPRMKFAMDYLTAQVQRTRKIAVSKLFPHLLKPRPQINYVYLWLVELSVFITWQVTTENCLGQSSGNLFWRSFSKLMWEYATRKKTQTSGWKTSFKKLWIRKIIFNQELNIACFYYQSFQSQLVIDIIDKFDGYTCS